MPAIKARKVATLTHKLTHTNAQERIHIPKNEENDGQVNDENRSKEGKRGVLTS